MSGQWAVDSGQGWRICYANLHLIDGTDFDEFFVIE